MSLTGCLGRTILRTDKAIQYEVSLVFSVVVTLLTMDAMHIVDCCAMGSKGKHPKQTSMAIS